jgi:hypothetical protein
MIALRGVLQPLLEWRAERDSEALAEALRIAESSGEAAGQDPLLGVGAGDRVTTRHRREAAGGRRVSSLAHLRRYFSKSGSYACSSSPPPVSGSPSARIR